MTKEEANNYAKQVKQWLLPAPKEFSDLGFEFDRMEVVEGNTEALGCFVMAIFRNRTAMRSLSLALATLNTEGFIESSISNDEMENEHFSLSDYLVHEDRSGEKLGFLRKAREAEETYVRRYLKLLCRYLTTELKDVVMGRTWIEVPFDWHGYK